MLTTTVTTRRFILQSRRNLVTTRGALCHLHSVATNNVCSKSNNRNNNNNHLPSQKVAFQNNKNNNIHKHQTNYVRYYSQTNIALNKEYPPHTLFPMPALSPTMESGTIASWALSEGDAFSAGDVLCSITTDKAAVDFEAQDDGVLAKILQSAGGSEDLPVGTPICVVTEEAEHVPAFADYQVTDNAGAGATAGATGGATSASRNDAPQEKPVAATSAAASPTGSSRLLPSARHLAESKGVDATVLQGSGKGGRVTKGDVLQALKSGVELPALAKKAASAPAAVTTTTPTPPATAPAKLTLANVMVPPTMNFDSASEDVANNKMRQIIAKRLTESKATVPHFYTTTEIALDNVMRLRKQWAADLDLKISVNDFILKASALALRDVPQVNASFSDKQNAVQRNNAVDISVAVATPTGLITPIVFGADRIGLSDLTATVQDLAKRARDGKLAPHEYQGGTFSVSNLGMFGIAEFAAVINPPQAAILAVGGGSPTVVPGPAVKNIMHARLSADRRVVDEPTAALFCQALSEYLQEPESLIL